MIAGLNLLCTVWRFTASPNDDSIGGAQPSGTPAYEKVPLRLQPIKPTQALMEQGLETIGFFSGLVSPGNLVLESNDEIEVTAPSTSEFYNERFRLVGPAGSSLVSFDSRYKMITVRRSEKALGNVYQ